VDSWSDVALQPYRLDGIMLAGTQLITNPEELEAGGLLQGATSP